MLLLIKAYLMLWTKSKVVDDGMYYFLSKNIILKKYSIHLSNIFLEMLLSFYIPRKHNIINNKKKKLILNKPIQITWLILETTLSWSTHNKRKWFKNWIEPYDEKVLHHTSKLWNLLCLNRYLHGKHICFHKISFLVHIMKGVTIEFEMTIYNPIHIDI
jgi:hypothetical protein